MIVDFDVQSNRFQKGRKLRTKKIILECINYCTTSENTCNLDAMKSYLMGMLVISEKEFNDAIIYLKENNCIKVFCGLVVTTEEYRICCKPNSLF